MQMKYWFGFLLMLGSAVANAAGTQVLTFTPNLAVTRSTQPNLKNACEVKVGDYTVTFTELGANVATLNVCTSALIYPTGGIGVGVMKTGTSGVLQVINNKGERFQVDTLTIIPHANTNLYLTPDISGTATASTVTLPAAGQAITYRPSGADSLLDLTGFSVSSSTDRFDVTAIQLTSIANTPFQSVHGLDIPNNTGVVARGFEIVLDGVGPGDVDAATLAKLNPTYPTPQVSTGYNYGTPDFHPRTTITWMSTYDFTQNTWQQGTPPGATEHFAYALSSTTPQKVTYHWLIDDGAGSSFGTTDPNTGAITWYKAGQQTLAPAHIDVTSPYLALTNGSQAWASLTAPLFDGVAEAPVALPTGGTVIAPGTESGETFVAEVPNVVAGIFLTDDVTQNCAPSSWIWGSCGTTGPGAVDPYVTVDAKLYEGVSVNGGTLLRKDTLTFKKPFTGYADVDYGKLGIKLVPGKTYTLTLTGVSGNGWVIPISVDAGWFSYVTPTGGGCMDGSYPWGKPIVDGQLLNGKACHGDLGFHAIPSPSVAAADNKYYGNAVWVKVYKADLPHNVLLSDMTVTNPVVPGAASQLEQDWFLLQDAVGGTANNLIFTSGLMSLYGSQIRKYEFYQYTGVYDQFHQALPFPALGTQPSPTDLGALFGSQEVAINDLTVPTPPLVGPTIDTVSLATATAGVDYYQPINVTVPNNDPATLTVEDNLIKPIGLYWDAQQQAIIGKPTALGSYTVTISLVDNATHLAATSELTIVVSDAAITFSPNLPDGTVGVDYSAKLAATGGYGLFTFAVEASTALPPGLSLVNGVISGRPTVAGSFPLWLTATDELGTVQPAKLTLTIQSVAPPPIGNYTVKDEAKGKITEIGVDYLKVGTKKLIWNGNTKITVNTQNGEQQVVNGFVQIGMIAQWKGLRDKATNTVLTSKLEIN